MVEPRKCPNPPAKVAGTPHFRTNEASALVRPSHEPLPNKWTPHRQPSPLRKERGRKLFEPSGVLTRMGILAFFLLMAGSVKAAIQFDVFLGFDQVVSEATWFPVVCEVKNDGPPFVGVIEVESGGFNQSQTRRVVVELPTGTLKRISIPVFSTARYQSRWDVRLLDERGKLRAEQTSLQPKVQLPAEMVVLGALPRSATGLPVIRRAGTQDNNNPQPTSARLQSQLLPDNPLVYEGMECVYINSEKAADIGAQQTEALLTWLNDGGHLVVAVEQGGDVNSVPWLKKIVPINLTDVQNVSSHSELQQWVRDTQTEEIVPEASSLPNRRVTSRLRGPHAKPFADLPEDSTFESAALSVAGGTLRPGAEVIASGGGVPLIVQSREGRGRVTVLMFSPEREPVRSWKNLPTFWARMAEVNPEYYTNPNMSQRGGYSVDGVFGAMIDSKQVRKLPVEWLLLLLIVYLVVIGPFDQYWLKRIKRPMLTWITFPCYVVLFSLLIYFIGYKLRAGESEWNELHLVDVLPKGQGSELRGRTYASIYSPVNQKYRVESQEEFATFRGEFQASWSGNQDTERADVMQNGDNFKAEIFVPVWTSQLYASDWLQSADIPFNYTVTKENGDWVIKVDNRLDHPLQHTRLVAPDGATERVMDLGDVPAGQSKTFRVKAGQGMQLQDFVAQHGGNFQNASQSRQHAFGSSVNAQIQDVPNATMAVSFISRLSNQGMHFIAPPGLDLVDVVDHGNAVLLAWSADYSPIQAMNQFSPRRSHKDTLWRMAVPMQGL